MNITNAVYTNAESSMLKADVDGTEMHIPAVAGNAHYDHIIAESISVTAYAAPEADMDELRALRDSEMDCMDTKKANAALYEDFTAQEKTDYKAWQQDMRDLPDTASLTGIDSGDTTALKALFPAKPSVIA